MYLKDSEGLSETNKFLLETGAGVVNALRGPWIAMGDWNMSPETLAASKWLEMVNGVIFATELPTCNDNVYDFFVVHRSLADAVAGVQRIQDGGLSPHWVSRLLVRGDAKRAAVRQLVRPAKVEGILPHGPARQCPDYSKVQKLIDSGGFGKAAIDWFKLARTEWSDLASENLAFKRCRFKWASAVCRTAAPKGRIHHDVGAMEEPRTES